MPELPEVESLRRMLARTIVGRRIVSTTVAEARLRRAISSEMPAEIADRQIVKLARRAKYLLLELDSEHILMVHLGMSGSLTHRHSPADSNGFDPRHDHVIFTLDDQSRLVYNDPRRFGLMKLVARGDFAALPELAGLGPEPFSAEFNADYLWKTSRGRTSAIKTFLMDQRIVAGVGNIYASEILFRAGVRPSRPAGKVTRAELGRIAALTRDVLRESIGRGGTTFRSYRDSRGQAGRFAPRLRVYDRAGQPCLTCAAPIRSLVLGQRSSFFCAQCQK